MYDPLYTLKTTINGQLLILNLVERLLLELDDCLLLQTNTDGATFRISRKDIDKYHSICKEWEQMSKLTLEFATYTKMVIRDVNNYFSIYDNGKIKGKGFFEYEPFEKHLASHLHKNKSELIVSKAVVKYFTEGIPPEKYIKESRNIYDFCIGVKLRNPWSFKEHSIKNGEVIVTEHKKLLRYYISNSGSKITKVHPDGRILQLNAGTELQTIFNKYIEKDWDDYNINYQYYLSKIYTEINNILPNVTQLYTQLSLF